MAGRPKKVEEKTVALTEKEVNQVLNAYEYMSQLDYDMTKFATSWRDTTSSPLYATPDSINQQMKNINMNPVQATIEGIESALKNPKDSERILRDYSTSTELINMLYKRLIQYIPNMASFNLTFDPVGIEKDSEFNSKEFKDDLKILDDFCARFDYRQEFLTVMKQLFRQGAFFGILRTEGVKYTIQELPPDFCKITGRHPYGLLFDFDMQWFVGNYGVDINMYPKVFKKIFNETLRRMHTEYNPHTAVNKRTSSFIYWHQCSPIDGFWAFKIEPEIATLVPYYAPLFADLNFQPTIRGLQNDKYFIEASKLLVGIIGFNKENKSGNVANAINMTPDLLGQFLGVARQGLNKQIGLVALPVEDIKTAEFDTSETNILSDYQSSVAKQAIASSDTMVSTNKLNTHQSKWASAIDMDLLYSLYPMFSNFIEYYVNNMTKKYKFRIRFNDAKTPDSVSERTDRFKTLSNIGIASINDMARVCDMSPFEFDRSLSLTKSFDIDKKLLPLLQIATQQVNGASGQTTSSSGEPGRPAKPDSDNDNTQESIGRGSNDEKVV